MSLPEVLTKKYETHRTVTAAKIIGITKIKKTNGERGTDGANLVLDNSRWVIVDADFVKANKPEPGDYYVRDSHGKFSAVNQEVFELEFHAVDESGE